MDFTALKTRVAEETGLDLTQDDTKVGTWVNAAYQHLSGLFNWPWLFKAATIQTVADITTGTATISAGSTTCTLSSGPAVSVANQYMIQFADISDDWYFISSHTAASTSLTLSVPLIGSTNLSAGAYTLRKVFYSLPSDVDRVIDIRQTVTKAKLAYIDPVTFDLNLPDPTATGTPLCYSMVGLDTSKYWQISVYPIPTAITNLQLKYYQRITELSASTDTPLVPDKWHEAIVFGALAMFGHPFIDDTRVREAAVRYKTLIDDMREHSSHVPDQMTVLQPWDSRVRRRIFRPQLPPNYPDNYGW